MGGLKRKIEIENLEENAKKSVAFTKRRKGLFSKAFELCRLSPGTQIAILATPVSSNSHASFYTFGHSSVDDVVSSFLNDHPPLSRTNQEKDLGLGFWWEDEGFDRLENVDELKEAADAVTRMLINVRLRLDAVKVDPRDKGKGIQQQEEDLQVRNTNEETTTRQIPSFEATTAFGSKSLLENEEDVLPIDDILTDVKNDTF
ncbi:unnamed protein product [Microthlaspi erraticum]|uniref:MADS-box domain-containing protein n=1 Tax=Microthlaspi erraticum TaxID=1685480 RepID=A0A6D2INY3_9BRAS|nr:unnamed protein product [Microthlaspi erraticum]